MKNVFLMIFLLICLPAMKAYDQMISQRLAVMSYASYCSPERLQTWNVAQYASFYPDIEEITIIQSENTDVLAFVSYVKEIDSIIVTFRGSQNRANWIANIDAKMRTFSESCNCKVHSGFYDSLQTIKEDLNQVIKNKMRIHPSSNVIVTGHSLGAAMATLFTADSYMSGILVSQLYTYGSPRVGDASFWQWAEENAFAKVEHFRVTNHQDPVIHLPQITLGFHHVNQEVYYYDNQYKLCDIAFGEDDTCSKQQKYHLFLLQDHETYLGIQSKTLTKECK